MSDIVLAEALEELIDHRGKTPTKLGAEFTTSGVPVASAIMVKDGRLDLSEARFVDQSTYGRWMPKATRKGDVLLTSEAPLGRVARVPSDDPLVLGQRLFALRGRVGVLDSGYLYYALQTSGVQRDLIGRSTGTTVFGIRQSALRQVCVPAPSYAEQVAIAEVLAALDDKIAANATAVRLMADLTAVLVRQCCAAGEAVALSDVAEMLSRGITPKYAVDAGWTVLNQKCIRDRQVDLSAARRTEPKWSAADRLLKRDDFLVNSTGQGTLGRTARWTRDGDSVTVDSHITIVRFDPEATDPAFVGAAALHLDQQIELLAEGSTGQTELRRDLLGALKLHLPLLDVQRRMGDYIRSMDETTLAVRAESERLAATRDELLPLLMSGRIHVRDVERAIGDVA